MSGDPLRAAAPNCSVTSRARAAVRPASRPPSRRARSHTSATVTRAAANDGTRKPDRTDPSVASASAASQIGKIGWADARPPRSGICHCPVTSISEPASAMPASAGHQGDRDPRPRPSVSPVNRSKAIKSRQVPGFIGGDRPSRRSDTARRRPRRRGGSCGPFSVSGRSEWGRSPRCS